MSSDNPGRSRLLLPLIRAFLLPVLLLALAGAAFAVAGRFPNIDAYRVDGDRLWGALALATGLLLVQRVVSTLLQWASRDAPRSVGGPVGHVLPLARRALNVAFFVIGVLLMLDQLGVSISPLLAGLGISGIAVALALQPLLTNLFAGSYVLSDASIRAGDYIIIQGGPSGRVETIGWRATRLRDPDAGTLIIVPNATLAAATVTNYGGSGSTVASIVLSLPHDVDLEAAEQAALEALRALIAESAHAAHAGEPVLRFQGATDERIALLVGATARSSADVPGLTHDMVKRVVPRVRAEASRTHEDASD
jgi:small-conductance mechanosensitive channel